MGKEFAKLTGETFLESVPSSFRGRVHCGSEDAPYITITDGQRFVLLPANKDARRWAGHTVDVGRDANGRFVLSEDPARVAERRELARLAAGEALARETRQTFLPTIPPGFQGRVEPGPERSPYVAVSDGQRFVLIRASPDERSLVGKTVEVARDAQGPLLVLRRRDRDHDLGR